MTVKHLPRQSEFQKSNSITLESDTMFLPCEFAHIESRWFGIVKTYYVYHLETGGSSITAGENTKILMPKDTLFVQYKFCKICSKNNKLSNLLIEIAEKCKYKSLAALAS